MGNQFFSGCQQLVVGCRVSPFLPKFYFQMIGSKQFISILLFIMKYFARYTSYALPPTPFIVGFQTAVISNHHLMGQAHLPHTLEVGTLQSLLDGFSEEPPELLALLPFSGELSCIY